mmetsp:Transcript_54578/g.152269  ORF Transcript_54578/g.152269 Transcript_54578/m.152269 type:complete len:216 (-) Transcript_54578:487-1134(-)
MAVEPTALKPVAPLSPSWSMPFDNSARRWSHCRRCSRLSRCSRASSSWSTSPNHPRTTPLATSLFCSMLTKGTLISFARHATRNSSTSVLLPPAPTAASKASAGTFDSMTPAMASTALRTISSSASGPSTGKSMSAASLLARLAREASLLSSDIAWMAPLPCVATNFALPLAASPNMLKSSCCTSKADTIFFRSSRSCSSFSIGRSNCGAIMATI